MPNSIKFPHVVVRDFGRDGNAYALMGQVTGAMRKANIPNDHVVAFTTEATSGDYDNLLQTCSSYVTLEFHDRHDDNDEEWYDNEECAYCGSDMCEYEECQDEEDEG